MKIEIVNYNKSNNKSDNSRYIHYNTLILSILDSVEVFRETILARASKLARGHLEIFIYKVEREQEIEHNPSY